VRLKPWWEAGIPDFVTKGGGGRHVEKYTLDAACLKLENICMESQHLIGCQVIPA